MDKLPIDLPFTKQFFASYLLDHFLYKQYALFNVLEKYTGLKTAVFDGIDDVEDDKVLTSLRLEIRATYFQAIETLFELIFSLEPRGSVIDNRNIWFFLSTSEWRKNYLRINSISAGDTAFLDRIITAGKNIEIPFLQYLFYFGVTDAEMLKCVRASADPIKTFLIKFAEEFSERDEYNAFKHALRIMPTVQTLEAIPHGEEKPILTLDMSGSVSYLLDEEDGTISLNSKPLDTIRDMRMGLICSYLISNIVRSRRAHFQKGHLAKVHTLSEETFPSANERNVTWTNFKLSMRPVYRPPMPHSRDESTSGKVLAAPNTMLWQFHSALIRQIEIARNATDVNERRQNVAVCVILSVTLVETFVNIYFRVLVSETDFNRFSVKILEDLKSQLSLDRKIKEWPRLVFGKSLELGQGMGQKFIELKNKRNWLMHFESTFESFNVGNTTVRGLSDISEFESLDVDEATTALSTSEGFISEVVKLRGANPDQIPLELQYWLGKARG